MHPAPSIIVFTVLSGLGLGLVFWLGLDLGPDWGAWRWVACALALVLAGGGGVASVGHLQNPKNAWRAFSQWRSSWLSREGCLMVAALGLFALYAALWCLADLRLWGLGLLAAGFALATVYATAMIYAQLKTVPRWHLTPTPCLFLASALVGGLLAFGAARGVTGAGFPTGAAFLALLVAAGIAVWWQTAAAGARRIAAGSSMETATGLGSIGRVRPFEPPHTGPNYLLREMAHVVARRRAYQIRLIGAVLGFAVPLLFTLLAWVAGDWALVPAFLSHVLGMLALRWLFFAEAEHVQALYYGAR